MDAMHRRTVAWATLAGALACAAHAAPPAPAPTVAAFERFARSAADAPGHLAPAAAGRILLGELGCTACHASADGDLAPKPGPDLSGVGSRVEPEWLASFLADPARAAPGTTMPHALLSAPQAQRPPVIAGLVAYLSSLRAEVPLPKPSGLNPMPPAFWERGTVATGRALYHRVGCVACHDPLPGHEARGGATALESRGAGLDAEDRAAAGLPALEAPFRSVALGHIGAKYTRRGLTEFLLVPLHARPAGRMPDMKLRAIEAADIAAALLDAHPAAAGPAAPGAPPDAEFIARGRAAFASHRCGACHATGETRAAVAATPLGELAPAAARGCIAEEPAEGGPVHYPLDGAQRAALRAALAGGPERLAPLDAALHRLNCLACHERDGRGGVGPGRTEFFETLGQVDLGDEGRLPPALTQVGARLTPAWMKKVLDGSGTLRPFMLVRMPAYPAALVGPLPAAFTGADRAAGGPSFPPPLPNSPAEREELYAAGARILDAGCIQCHALGDHALPDVVGVNLADVTRRVEPAWFRRLLLHPQEVRRLTKMPAFFGDTRPRTILDGDAERQVAAVWHWLDRKPPAPLPERIRAAAASDLELVPADRPIVFRTFMSRAGTRAIAVGFPAGVHLAFDAERCRVAEVWRGRFLDARGTWILAKSAPPTDPLGAALPVDDGPVVSSLPAPGGPRPAAALVRFDGYALDAAGVPTFRYRIDGRRVAERWAPPEAAGPDGGGGLVRRLSVERGDGPPLAARLARGADLAAEATDARAVRRGDGMTIAVAGSQGGAMLREVPDAPGEREWLVPLPDDGTPLEVRYRW